MAEHRPRPTVALSGDPHDPLDGTPYRTLVRLGGGGMGEVFEAEHRGLRKRVVVKLLHRELAHDPRFADRLRVEAQALAVVSSPHVVSVTDLGRTPGGRAYLVMERLHGRTLREELEARGPLPIVEAIGITRQVLAGLAAAHRLGIIHRDVKLDNVFLCAPGELGVPVVKVLDFGIAKVLHAAPSPTAALPTAAQYPTEEGMLVGSPRTVSPEQARFQKVDARTDLYAVGLLLYTLIAGQGPFAHDNVLDLLNAHIYQAPAPPSRVARQPIPPELDWAILKALAKRPEHRFQSAELFSEELEGIARLLAGTTPDLPGSRREDGGGSCDRGQDEILTSRPFPSPAVRTTGQDTMVLPGPATPDAWFAAAANLAPVVKLPANLARPVRPPGEHRAFVALTLASTAVFSLIAALALRYLGGR